MKIEELSGIFDKEISLFRNAMITKNPQHITLKELLRNLSGGTYAEQVTTARASLKVGQEEYGKFKKNNVTGFTLSANCYHRISDEKATESERANKLIYHTGILQIDIDEIGKDRLPEVKQILETDKHTLFSFVSLSGQGLKAGIIIDGKNHLESFRQAERYYKETYNLTIDTKVKDIFRLCFVSYDADLFVNPQAESFVIQPATKRQDSAKPKNSKITDNSATTNDRRKQYAERGLNNAKNILNQSKRGGRHDARLRAGKLLGGYVGGNFFSKEYAMTEIKSTVERNTDLPIEKAMKVIADSIEHGMKTPITFEDLEAEREEHNRRNRHSQHKTVIQSINHDTGEFTEADTDNDNEADTGNDIETETTDGAAQDGAQGTTQGTTDEPLPDGVPFPTSVFPPALREIIESYSTATGSPPDFLGASMLTVIGALIGNRLELHFGNFSASGVLWTALVAPSGAGKTEPINATLAPLRKYDNEAFSAYRRACADYEIQVRNTSKKADKPAPPEQPAHYVITDATLESLHQQTEHGRGIIMYRDELVSWFGSFNQYRSGADLENWLSLWVGVPIFVSRKSGAISVQNPHVSVIGGIQNDRLKTLASDEKAASGFFARLLFCYPKIAPPPLLSHEETNFEAWAQCVGRIVENITPQLNNDGTPAPLICQYSDEAWEIIQNYDDELRTELSAEPDGLTATTVSKMRVYLHRLALISQALFYGAGETKIVVTIEPESAAVAVELCRYFRYCSDKVICTLSEQAADALLKKSVLRLKEQGQTLETIAQRLDITLWKVRTLLNPNLHKSTRRRAKP